jgi:hypothetical protein
MPFPALQGFRRGFDQIGLRNEVGGSPLFTTGAEWEYLVQATRRHQFE